MKIFKYYIPTLECQIDIPRGAKILSVGSDLQKRLCLWAVVNDGARPAPRNIRLFLTGESLPDNPGAFVGTTTWGGLILHAFDQGESI